MIEIYSKSNCIYCERAKEMLVSRSLNYTSYDIENDFELREQMLERVPGAKTVPQIFIDGERIGGYDELRVYFRNQDKQL